MLRLFIFLILASFHIGAFEPIEPIPLTLSFDESKASLGEIIFNDKSFSKNDIISCATCHLLDKGGGNRASSFTTFDGTVIPVKVPTVFNAIYYPMLRMEGNEATIKEFLNSPGLPLVLGLKPEEIVAKFKKNDDYVKKFREIYSDEINYDHIVDALVEFHKSLTTPNSRFDKWLQGDKTALSKEEVQGYNLFKEIGCIMCHNGMTIGTNSFQKMGVAREYFSNRGNVTSVDFGRFNVTQHEWDKFVFRVPSLRNIALNFPYMYDGQTKTLEDAVKLMASVQLDKDLSDQEVALLVKFLNTLTGELKGKPLK